MSESTPFLEALTFKVNGQSRSIEAVDPTMPLLWVLRDLMGLTGTKYGCGRGLCGACTVLVDGEAVRSCLLPASNLGGREVTTIEGLSRGTALHAVQRAWLEEDVSQCGYCQPGQVMSVVGLLTSTPDPKPAAVEAALAGNICRCGMYPKIKNAVQRAAELLREEGIK